MKPKIKFIGFQDMFPMSAPIALFNISGHSKFTDKTTLALPTLLENEIKPKEIPGYYKINIINFILYIKYKIKLITKLV